MSDDPFARWIGQSQLGRDLIAAEPLERLAAVLDEAAEPRSGDPVPPLGHWLYFLSCERQGVLGENGYAHHTDELPPIPDLTRRMWAGSRVEIKSDLRVGDLAERRSAIGAIREKQGSHGRLLFVTFRHEIGRPGEPASIIEENDVLFRGEAGGGGRYQAAETSGAEWVDTVPTDAMILFRFSALTFNAHRIHYDHVYATEVEGYPGLVVHAPLIAILLAHRAQRQRPGRRVAALNIWAVAPAFVNADLTLRGSAPNPSDRVRLWAATEGERLVVQGDLSFA